MNADNNYPPGAAERLLAVQSKEQRAAHTAMMAHVTATREQAKHLQEHLGDYIIIHANCGP